MIEYHESYAIIDKHIERCFNFWRSNPLNTSKEIIQNVYCDLCNLKYDPNTPRGDELDPRLLKITSVNSKKDMVIIYDIKQKRTWSNRKKILF